MRINGKNSFFTMINEMLTDSLAQIVQLKAYDQDFINPDTRAIVQSGYSRLVDMGRYLLRFKVITEDQFVTFAKDQNTEGLIDFICNFASKNMTNARLILNIFRRLDLIFPIKSSEVNANISKLNSNPFKFIKEQFTKAIDKNGVGAQLYLIKMLEILRKNTTDEYINNKALEEARRQKVDIKSLDVNGEYSYFLLYNSEGFYTDEAVQAYYEMISNNTSQVGNYRISEADLIFSAYHDDKSQNPFNSSDVFNTFSYE